MSCSASRAAQVRTARHWHSALSAGTSGASYDTRSFSWQASSCQVQLHCTVCQQYPVHVLALRCSPHAAPNDRLSVTRPPTAAGRPAPPAAVWHASRDRRRSPSIAVGTKNVMRSAAATGTGRPLAVCWHQICFSKHAAMHSVSARNLRCLQLYSSESRGVRLYDLYDCSTRASAALAAGEVRARTCIMGCTARALRT